MKRNAIIVILILISYSCLGQKIRFTDTSNHWFTQGKDPLDTVFQGAYYYVPTFDQVFNGKKYLALFSNMASHTGGTSYTFHVREDTTTGMVYLWSRTDSKEVVLFNYNLHVGDTIHFYNYANPAFIDSVLKVDSVLIKGVYHKVFSMYELEPFYQFDNRYYTYVEGIGSINQPLEQRFFEHFGTRELLNCFKTSDSAYAVNIPFLDSFDTKTLHFVDDCAVVSTSDVHREIRNAVIVRPNPIDPNAEMVFPEKISSGSLIIYNSIGQIVVDVTLYNQSILRIGDNVKGRGIYFYKVINKVTGSIYTGNFVK